MRTNMEKYNYTIIEDWWRHLGCFGRKQASPIYWASTIEDGSDYLQKTDEWWEKLTDEQKLDVYNEFFDES